MQESTNNNRNETQPQHKVRAWKTHSVHQSFGRANETRSDLEGQYDGVKIRLRARGFLVKTWDGSMQSAPPPRPKKEANAPVDISSTF